MFDCDGVLVDSEPQANRVISEVLADQGIMMTPEECREVFVGLNPGGVARRLIELRGIDLTAVLTTQIVRRFLAVLDRDGTAMVPGASDAISHFARRGVLLACASNSPLEELKLKLRIARLADRFGEHVHSGDALGRSKPDPGVYLHAAAGLGVEPAACVVVEDSATGVTAGVRAGMRVLGFTGTHADAASAGRLIAAGAARTFARMEELPGLIDLG